MPGCNAFRQAAKPGRASWRPEARSFINTRGIDAGREQCVALRRQRLRSISFGHPHISDEHHYLARKEINHPAICRWFPQRVFRSLGNVVEAKIDTARKPVVSGARIGIPVPPLPMASLGRRQSGTHFVKQRPPCRPAFRSAVSRPDHPLFTRCPQSLRGLASRSSNSFSNRHSPGVSTSALPRWARSPTANYTRSAWSWSGGLVMIDAITLSRITDDS